MDTFELATVVIAGTALVLAPVDPQPIRDLNEPTPPCTWEPTFDDALTRRVCTALGLRYGKPRPEEGETETRILVWSVYELNDLFARVGGIPTLRQVERALCPNITYQSIEITVTVNVDGVGPVEAFTDWDPRHESAAFGTPLFRVLSAPAPRVAETVPAQGGLRGYDRLYFTPGAPLPSGRTIMHVEDPMGSAWRVVDDQGDVHWLHKQGQLKRYTNGNVAFIVPDSVYDLR